MSAPPLPRAVRALLPETERAMCVRRTSYAGADLTSELRTPAGTMRLFPVQSSMLAAIREARGGLGLIGVGHGKTLISFLAGTVLGARMTLLLTKPAIVAQAKRDYHRLVEHWRLGPVQVWSYAALSRPERSDALTRLAETYGSGLLVVADECHELRNLDSARTRRVARMMQERAVPFVALSGTVASRSLRDFAHLAEWALGVNSPIPRASQGRYQSHLEAWAETTDAMGRPAAEHWGTVWPLIAEFGDLPQQQAAAAQGAARLEIARRALRARLASAPGVVMTTASSIGTALEITVSRPEIPPEIRRLLQLVDDTSTRPDGEVLVDDLARATCRRQITAGYYLRWEWPGGVVDHDWLSARAAWARCVREELEERSADGYDSPLLVWQAIGRQVAEGETGYVHRCWSAWDRQRHKPTPPTVVEWVSDYYLRLVADAIGAETQQGPTIVWYQSSAVEAFLRLCGIPVYGAGVLPPEDGAETVACSVVAHGTGRNLQAWSRNLIVEMSGNGTRVEQLLGRTHRTGQTADAVSVCLFAHGAFGDALESALRDATYTEASYGTPQKLLQATWLGDVPVTVERAAGRAGVSL